MAVPLIPPPKELKFPFGDYLYEILDWADGTREITITPLAPETQKRGVPPKGNPAKPQPNTAPPRRTKARLDHP